MTGILIALSVLAGVLLRDSHAGVVLVFPIALTAILFAVASRSNSQRLLVLACLACVGLGAWRAQPSDAQSGPVVVPINETDHSITATVDGLPRNTATRSLVNLRFESERHRPVVASLPLLPVVQDGDVIRFWPASNWSSSATGTVELPLGPQNDLYVPSFEIVGADVSTARAERNRLTAYVTRAMREHVPEPAGALALGIMTGDDTGMTSATRAAFRTAGLSHITAVSGWNVAVLAGMIIILLRRLAPPRTVSSLAAIAMIWGYAFLVGMQPSVVRAAAMATIFLIAHVRGRPGDLLTSLLLTTAIIVVITPSIRLDIGFQLSVAATVGIVLLLELSQERPWWQSAIAVPVVAELAVAPLLLHHLGFYSLASPLANLAAAPLVELVMWTGLFVVGFAWIFPGVAELFGTITWVPARLIIAIADRTASFRWASNTTMTISWSTTLIVYLTMICCYLLWFKSREWQRDPAGPIDLAPRI